jgi:transcriptional regulator with XRE-family HTH domain
MTENDRDDRPTPRKALGGRLRKLRERAGLSLRELADDTTYNHTYLHRVELGQQLPSEALVTVLDTRFDTDGLLAELLEMARSGSIQEYSRKTIDKEATALRIQVSTSSVIPGLLQTDAYTRALFTANSPSTPPNEIDDAVAARMARKRTLNRGNNSALLWAIIDESALKRTVGTKGVMKEQLLSLIKDATSRDITIQVYPFERGDHPMLEGSLTLLTMKDGAVS